MADEGRIIQKAWGREEILTLQEQYTAKRLHVKPGHMCSLHYHPVKDETFIVESGSGWLQIGEEIRQATPGSTVRVPRLQPHRFWCYGSHLTILEVSTKHSDEDVVRLTESGPVREWGRNGSEPESGDA